MLSYSFVVCDYWAITIKETYLLVVLTTLIDNHDLYFLLLLVALPEHLESVSSGWAYLR